MVAAVAINPNTVLRAYRELEREGLVEPRPGQGTFVQRSLSRAAAGADSPLRAEAVVWVARARAAGLEREDIEALTEAALDATFAVAPAAPGPGPGPTPSPERATRRSPQSMEEDT
ncbi:GntR family transcriptional regulator [Streptomyces albireticuli]|uniref:GntR family transcriptional regulator n=1 Tax=Streptomyces albireticuli TaxID=1940 RepID=A0A1Z2L5Q0_9ACTN|nr:GntR family transcriptional regulator [Streptomyces albireticuli]